MIDDCLLFSFKRLGLGWSQLMTISAGKKFGKSWNQYWKQIRRYLTIVEEASTRKLWGLKEEWGLEPALRSGLLRRRKTRPTRPRCDASSLWRVWQTPWRLWWAKPYLKDVDQSSKSNGDADHQGDVDRSFCGSRRRHRQERQLKWHLLHPCVEDQLEHHRISASFAPINVSKIFLFLVSFSSTCETQFIR